MACQILLNKKGRKYIYALVGTLHFVSFYYGYLLPHTRKACQGFSRKQFFTGFILTQIDLSEHKC